MCITLISAMMHECCCHGYLQSYRPRPSECRYLKPAGQSAACPCLFIPMLKCSFCTLHSLDPWITMQTTCCFQSVVEQGEKASAAGRQTLPLLCELHKTTRRPLDRLISERSWRGREPRRRGTSSAFVSSHFLRRTKKKRKIKEQTLRVG